MAPNATIMGDFLFGFQTFFLLSFDVQGKKVSVLLESTHLKLFDFPLLILAPNVNIILHSNLIIFYRTKCLLYIVAPNVKQWISGFIGILTLDILTKTTRVYTTAFSEPIPPNFWFRILSDFGTKFVCTGPLKSENFLDRSNF